MLETVALFVLLQISLFVIFLIVIPMAKVFSKAGRSGWLVFVPIYNVYVMNEIAGLPWWVFLLTFLPFVNFVVFLVIIYHLCERFGRGMGTTIGLVFLPFIFWPILGYGSSVYTPKQNIN